MDGPRPTIAVRQPRADARSHAERCARRTAANAERYIIGAALAILADGTVHHANDILTQALAKGVLPASTSRNTSTPSLHEYVERTLGADDWAASRRRRCRRGARPAATPPRSRDRCSAISRSTSAATGAPTAPSPRRSVARATGRPSGAKPRVRARSSRSTARAAREVSCRFDEELRRPSPPVARRGRSPCCSGSTTTVGESASPSSPRRSRASAGRCRRRSGTASPPDAGVAGRSRSQDRRALAADAAPATRRDRKPPCDGWARDAHGALARAPAPPTLQPRPRHGHAEEGAAPH